MLRGSRGRGWYSTYAASAQLQLSVSSSGRSCGWCLLPTPTARDVAVGPAAAGTAVAFAATGAKRTCGDAHRACWGCKLIAGSEATAEHPTHGLGGVSFMPAVSVCAWSAGKGRSLVAARGGSKVASGGTRRVSGCHGLWSLCSARPEAVQQPSWWQVYGGVP